MKNKLGRTSKEEQNASSKNNNGALWFQMIPQVEGRR